MIDSQSKECVCRAQRNSNSKQRKKYTKSILMPFDLNWFSKNYYNVVDRHTWA